MPLPPPISLTKFPVLIEPGLAPHITLKTNKIEPASVSNINTSLI